MASERLIINDEVKEEDNSKQLSDRSKKRKKGTDDDSEQIVKKVPRDSLKRMLVGDLCRLHLGKDVYLVANVFAGRTLVHVRVYDTRPDGRTFPTKKGIALNLQRWKKLQDWYADDVDRAIDKFDRGEEVDLRAHLGGNYYVSVKTGYACVNIRKWFMPTEENELRPTRNGIGLNFAQWRKMKDGMTLLPEFIGDQLTETEFCERSSDHANQMGMLECFECNPNQTFE